MKTHISKTHKNKTQSNTNYETQMKLSIEKAKKHMKSERPRERIVTRMGGKLNLARTLEVRGISLDEFVRRNILHGPCSCHSWTSSTERMLISILNFSLRDSEFAAAILKLGFLLRFGFWPFMFCPTRFYWASLPYN